MSLPYEVRTVRELVERLDGPAKGRIIECVRFYVSDNPRSEVRYPVGEGARMTWFADQWGYLFARRIGDGRSMIVVWRGGAAWLYRGFPDTVADLLGPKAVTMHDELRMRYPIFAPKSIDREIQS